MIGGLATGAQAQNARIGVELNKTEAIEGGCRTFFLFRNGSDAEFTGFEMSLAILDTAGVIDRLLTVEAAPLPAKRTTLKLFEIPEIACDQISEILFHDLPKCEAAVGAPEDCFSMIELSSRSPVALVQ
jgi:hypothetical protein